LVVYFVWSNFGFPLLWYFIQCIHLCLCMLKWSWVIFQSPQTHQHWCFHPPLSVPLIHNNLEMQIDT
jgi:hypothetical protein